MLEWVYEAARASRALDQVIIATDSDEIMTLAESRGWTAMLTSPSLPSGSDRVHAVARSIPADIYVNIQGDEPLLRPAHITALLQPFHRMGEAAEVSTLATPCPEDEVADPNTVKVVTNAEGRALYFSRAPIPYSRDGHGTAHYRKHLGLYAYRHAALTRFAHLSASPLEQLERLEQLRLLEHGIAVYVEETPFDTIGVDTEADLARAEAALARGVHP